MVSECCIARLTHANRLQYPKSRYFRLEATAFIAEDLPAIATMVLSFVQCESKGNKCIQVMIARVNETPVQRT